MLGLYLDNGKENGNYYLEGGGVEWASFLVSSGHLF